ncbi:Hypothetical predicted protein [Cloeon dipterum]|uniref:t-SNARE coiled-coil homology domain-containing protein n=1 Tax=Cloeon dipterum TaxID=197152 RepID=A0A8S1BYJ4_9INSE|nr:Hypothetical predicted protein [Cloeon dipterum]
MLIKTLGNPKSEAAINCLEKSTSCCLSAVGNSTQPISQLEQTQPISPITAEERERRFRDMESLKSCMVRLQSQFERRRGTQPSHEPSTSWDNAGSTGEIRSHMRVLEEEQDRGLDALSKIVSRQKQIAETIDGELGNQNEILDDIAVRVDTTDENILTETRHVAVVDRKDSTCGYWTVIILLLIAIVCVWVI